MTPKYKVEKLLQPNILWAHKDSENNTNYLVEIPPSLLPFSTGRYDSRGSRLVAMPWQYLFIKLSYYADHWTKPPPPPVFHIGWCQIFWSYKQIHSGNDLVRVARLPNIADGAHSQGFVCIGSTPRQSKTAEGAIENFVESLYLSNWNHDYGWDIPYRNLDTWSERSMENPELWKRWKITNLWKPVRDFLPIIDTMEGVFSE